MNQDLHSKRENYAKFTLEDKDILSNPLILFDEWYKLAEDDTTILEPNCMNISTSEDKIPRSRIVLLKEYSADGFVFYTNYNSKKGKSISKNNHVCLHFFWPSLEKQIIIMGIAEKVSEEKSQTYFKSRPKGSKIGAIISNQSQIIKNRAELEREKVKLEECNESELQKPKHWGGYIIKPNSFEFWQGRPSRLHDRIEYYKHNNNWNWRRLSP